MNKALICLGANTACADANIEGATQFLTTLGAIHKSTPLYPTAPEHCGDVPPYLNRVVELHTDADFDNLRVATKQYEKKIRDLRVTAPLVAIDIDIVLWNGDVLRPADAASQYFRQGCQMIDMTF